MIDTGTWERVATMETPPDFELLAVSPGRVLVSTRDELGLEHMSVYRILHETESQP